MSQAYVSKIHIVCCKLVNTAEHFGVKKQVNIDPKLAVL